MISYVVSFSLFSGDSIILALEQFPFLFYVFVFWFIAFQLLSLYFLFYMFREGEDFIEKFLPCILGLGLFLLMFIVDMKIYNAVF